MKDDKLIIVLSILLFMLGGCRKDKLQWENIKWSNDINQIENFISEFPESIYLDSALMTLERMIFLKSDSSTTVSGTFEDYVSFVKNHPRIVEIINAKEKVEYLKLKSDTIEIYGRLVDTEDIPLSGERINTIPLTEKGTFIIEVGSDGLIVEYPYDITKSDGHFLIKAHRSFLYENNEFFFDVPNYGRYQTKEGIPIVIQIDSNLRVLEFDTLFVEK